VFHEIFVPRKFGAIRYSRVITSLLQSNLIGPPTFWQRERERNRPFNRPIFLCGEKWSGNETRVPGPTWPGMSMPWRECKVPGSQVQHVLGYRRTSWDVHAMEAV